MSDLAISHTEELLKKAQEAVTSVSISRSPGIDSDRKASFLFLFLKSLRTSRSIVALLSQNLCEDGMILMRSLLENQITYCWIKKNGDKAVIRFARHEYATRLRKHELSRTKVIYHRDPEEIDYLLYQSKIEEKLKSLDELLKKLDPKFDAKKQKKLDESGLWAGITLEEMAAELSSSKALPNAKWLKDIPYTMGNEFVHPNPVTFWHYVQERDGKIEPLLSPQESMIDNILMIVWKTILELMRSLMEDLSLPWEEVIEQSENRFQEVFSGR
ncbi:MAG TPA: DUF5677 domain-containing protein [Bacteroidota bacterium]|nr:DUF5677 domain-containing protein [Bacteroidota bacterium]